MKKIALFSDGTGNSSSSPQKTNVWRTYHALDVSPGSSQIAFYDNGVGTSVFSVTAVLGLAFGWGLARNVRQIYGFLCRTYDPGDQIYGFGFSRGAFTMRVVIGLIASQGIVDRNRAQNERDLDRLVACAYNEFRKNSFTPSLLSFLLRPLRDLWLNTYHRLNGRSLYQADKNIRYRDQDGDEPLIKFVGVWDTVDAYGLPIDELTRAWDKVVWPLSANDRSPSPRIGRACHALALDEQRESFEPMLWNEKGVGDDRLIQVWFPGVHSNVGGGYPDDGLAFISLDWMLTESEKNDGLTYLPEERARYQPDSNGPIYDSRGGTGVLYRYAPRKLEWLCKQKKPGLANWLKRKLNGLTRRPDRFAVNANEVNIARPKIHHSVTDRLVKSGDAYAPINLPADYAIVDRTGAVIDIKEPGDNKFPLLESLEQAKKRRVRQSYVWTKVWSRQILYLMTLALIFTFVAYPYFAEVSVSKTFEPLFGTLSEPIRAIPDLVGKIPGLGFAESWASKYADFPFEFTLGIILIVGILFWSSKVNAALNDEMRANWTHLTKSAAPAPKVPALRKRWAGFLDGGVYRDKVETPIRIGLEAVAVLFLVFLVIAVFSRLFFLAADGLGAFCSDTETPDRQIGEWLDFDPKSTCADTGLTLEAGDKYAIELKVSDDWYDATIAADANGWRPRAAGDKKNIVSAPWYMNLFVPVRRHLFADWYQPIARVDDKLFDRYPLHTTGLQPETENTRKLCMPIEARRTGRLYLYLNDAVLFVPGSFYKNNVGSASVRVTALKNSETGCGNNSEQ